MNELHSTGFRPDRGLIVGFSLGRIFVGERCLPSEQLLSDSLRLSRQLFPDAFDKYRIVTYSFNRIKKTGRVLECSSDKSKSVQMCTIEDPPMKPMPNLSEDFSWLPSQFSFVGSRFSRGLSITSGGRSSVFHLSLLVCYLAGIETVFLETNAERRDAPSVDQNAESVKGSGAEDGGNQ